MKILGIVGSPRGLKGNTGRLMMEVLMAAEGEGASVKAIALPGGTVLPSPQILDKAQTLGRKLVHDWKHRLPTPEIEASKTRFMEGMRATDAVSQERVA